MTDMRQCELHQVAYWDDAGCPMCQLVAERGSFAVTIVNLRQQVTAAEAANTALTKRVGELEPDIDGAVYAAALKWCGEKDRETFQEDIEYFTYNWRSLPGLEAYVHREIGRAALKGAKP